MERTKKPDTKEKTEKKEQEIDPAIKLEAGEEQVKEKTEEKVIQQHQTVDPDPLIWWKRVDGKKSHRIGNHIIKPNEKFRARPSQVPLSFRDVIKPLQPIPEEMPIINEKVEHLTFELKPCGVGWFDVVDSKGKIWNENKSLRKRDAEELINKLSQ